MGSLFQWWKIPRVLPWTRSDYVPLCQRCERLERLANVEQPPLSETKYRASIVARIDNTPIDTSCVLCTGLGQFLRHVVWEPSSQVVPPTRSVELLQYHSIEHGTYFAIRYRSTGRELQIFLVDLAILRGFLGAGIVQPFSSGLCEYGPDGMSTSRLCDPPALDTNNLKEWYEECSSNHRQNCGKIRQDGMRPDRLIDCRLRELCYSNEPYVCLSYVWGSIMLNHDSASCTLPHDLPSTISDAMEVTLRIGMRYLWVDRYCIDQDNEVEKHNIIRNMDAIYGGAELTIIAAAGRGPDHGLPGLSRTREPRRTLKMGKQVFVAVENPAIDIGSSEWNSRAWTYQEALLSRRRLVFTDRQVYFQCRHGHRMEGLQLPNFIEVPQKRRAFPESGIGIRAAEIYDRLQEYYARKLSFNTDILNALLGIFRAFERHTLGSIRPCALHFYGIPIITSRAEVLRFSNPHKSFAAGLAWRVINCNHENTLSGTATVSSNYPSWTWAALKAQRPQTDPGELSFLYPRSLSLYWLDGMVRIHLHHQSGVNINLVDYVSQDYDYTAFSPLLHIRSRTKSGKLLRSNSDLVTFAPCPTMTLHLDQALSNASLDAIAIYVGYTDKGSDINMAFLLVETVNSEHCRRLGVLFHRFVLDTNRFKRFCSEQNRFDKDPVSHGFYLQNFCGLDEWQEKRLVLI